MAEAAKTYADLVSLIEKSEKEYDLALIEKAYKFAEAAHQGQVRRSGEPYIGGITMENEGLTKWELMTPDERMDEIRWLLELSGRMCMAMAAVKVFDLFYAKVEDEETEETDDGAG